MRRRGLRRLTVALLLTAAVATACSGGSSTHRSAAPGPAASSPVSSATPETAATPLSPSAPPTPKSSTPGVRPSSPRTTAAASPRRAQQLPLRYPAGNATEAITVTAPSTGSTQGTLQAWNRTAGGWRRFGPSVHAWLGSDGLSAHPSESTSATPIGSFTLTQAFGHDADPGTSLPYTRTTPDDWWVSQPGPLYNTRQRCASGCAFTRGDPNEHLYYETPYYRYAVVIDYNTRNAPSGVRQGAGSAYFLHVTVGAPTQGCISIAQDQLVRLLRWLTPARHPRILIGVD